MTVSLTPQGEIKVAATGVTTSSTTDIGTLNTLAASARIPAYHSYVIGPALTLGPGVTLTVEHDAHLVIVG